MSTKYIKRNRATGDFIEWDRMRKGARSVSATQPHEVGVPMTDYEEAEFLYMELHDMDESIEPLYKFEIIRK